MRITTADIWRGEAKRAERNIRDQKALVDEAFDRLTEIDMATLREPGVQERWDVLFFTAQYRRRTLERMEAEMEEALVLASLAEAEQRAVALTARDG